MEFALSLNSETLEPEAHLRPSVAASKSTCNDVRASSEADARTKCSGGGRRGGSPLAGGGGVGGDFSLTNSAWYEFSLDDRSDGGL